MEHIAEDAALLGKLRNDLIERAQIVSTVVEGKAADGAKYRDHLSPRAAA